MGDELCNHSKIFGEIWDQKVFKTKKTMTFGLAQGRRNSLNSYTEQEFSAVAASLGRMRQSTPAGIIFTIIGTGGSVLLCIL